ncbi:polysaccharide deacetylase family protein [Streptosporangium sp. KLBMP 9127]|nr:polysaccharide deacetylase family protein [Streptosporangium sp. KLBMP 9127]
MFRAPGLALLLAVLLGVVGSCGVVAEEPRTVVALTFDDGLESQLAAVDLLREHGLRATFYVSSGLLGRDGRMTAGQVRDLAEAGHEIGGHTLTHARLPTLSLRAQRREICDDRRALTGLGLAVPTLAYPYGAFDRSTAGLASECGYTGARGSGAGASGDPFNLPTAPAVVRTTSLATLQGHVRRSGLVTLVFHEVCASCGEYSVDPGVLAAFLGWLAVQPGVEVRPLGEAMRGKEAG